MNTLNVDWIEKQDEPMPLGTILRTGAMGAMKWHDEQRCCDLHGPYWARVVFVNGQKVSDGCCPECRRLHEAESARRSEEINAQIEAKRERRRLEEALGRACIPADFKDKSFATFITDTPELEQALGLAKRFVNGWNKAKECGYGLFFYGNPGTGKSHLAISIIKALLPNVTALYTRVPDMIGYIRAMWHPDSETSSYAAIRSYVDLDLLVLDELGVQAGSINEQTLLFEVIDARLSENRPTIFLSNLKPSDLAPIIGERLIDRIKGKCVPQQFSGKSRRKALTADVFGEAV